MPSPTTNVKGLERKIRELEEKDQLSAANERTLQFLRTWREYAGRDIALWVQPRGKINRSETPPGRVRWVTDKAAAHELTYAEPGTVRLATSEEIAADRIDQEVRRRQIEAAQAAQSMRLARSTLEGILGAALPQGFAPAAAEPKPITLDDVLSLPPDQIDQVIAALAKARAGRTQGSQATPEAGLPEAETATAAPTVSSAGPLLSNLGSESLVRSLTEAGFDTVAAVAAATINDLVERVKGVGPARAAELVTKASELLAAAAPATQEA